MQTVDLKNAGFDIIFEYLRGTLSSPDELAETLSADYFETHRSIGFLVPRQKGKTCWVVHRLDKDPNAIAIVLDKKHQTTIIERMRYEPTDTKARVFTFDQIRDQLREYRENNKIPDCSFSTVYLDEVRDELAYYENEFGNNPVHEWLVLKGDPSITLVYVG